ncbi:hypothetical protein ABEF95_006634 [Exophiala dermatitidis]
MEAMRMRSAIGLGIYRVTPAEGAKIDGAIYPGNTEVAVNGWVLHGDKAVFGDDADKYRLERCFERDAKLMNSHKYQLGSGSHLCIGRNLALLEMNKLLVQIFEGIRHHPGEPGPPSAVPYNVLRGATSARGVFAQTIGPRMVVN